MGSAFTPGGEARGVIPSVMESIFARVTAAPKDIEFTVRVGFVEIHKVGKRGQLLACKSCWLSLFAAVQMSRGAHACAVSAEPPPAGSLRQADWGTLCAAYLHRLSCLPAPLQEEIHDLLCSGRGPHPAVHIREAGGSVCLAGASEKEVHSQEEMVGVLEHGTLLRATGGRGEGAFNMQY